MSLERGHSAIIALLLLLKNLQNWFDKNGFGN
jgi:hypothetical protein